MCNFTNGFLLGTAFGAALLMAINPMDKKSMYKNCCKASRMMKKMNRSINHAMHNFI